MECVCYISQFLDDLHNIDLFINLISCFIQASLCTTLLTTAIALLTWHFIDEPLKEIVIFCRVNKLGFIKVRQMLTGLGIHFLDFKETRDHVVVEVVEIKYASNR